MTNPIPFDAVALGSDETPAASTTDSLVTCENEAGNNDDECPDSRLQKSGSMQMKVRLSLTDQATCCLFGQACLGGFIWQGRIGQARQRRERCIFRYSAREFVLVSRNILVILGWPLWPKAFKSLSMLVGNGLLAREKYLAPPKMRLEATATTER